MPMTLDGTSGMTAPQGAVYNGLQMATAQSSGSGTTIDFTGIPLWAKRVTITLNSVSTNGTSDYICQLGSGSFTISGYVGMGSRIGGSTVASTTLTTGLPLAASGITAAASYSGILTIVNQTGNIWVSSFVGSDGANNTYVGNGVITLSGSLDRVRITTVSANTFDAGTINIMYE